MLNVIVNGNHHSIDLKVPIQSVKDGRSHCRFLFLEQYDTLFEECIWEVNTISSEIKELEDSFHMNKFSFIINNKVTSLIMRRNRVYNEMLRILNESIDLVDRYFIRTTTSKSLKNYTILTQKLNKCKEVIETLLNKNKVLD